MADAKFPKGIFFKLPHGNAPEYIRGKILIRRVDAIEFLQSEESEWISLDLKVSRDGKPYAQIDEWKPDHSRVSQEPRARTGSFEQPERDVVATGKDDDLPF